MKRCHICTRPIDHDHDPHAPEGHYNGDEYNVVMRNGFYVAACWSCWFKWPDAHKRWPVEGYGRSMEPVDVLALLQETAA